MRTTVSIPDPVFEAAERLAQQLGISRSELFAQALTAFIEAHKRPVAVHLDRVHAVEDSSLDEDPWQWPALSARCGFSDSW